MPCLMLSAAEFKERGLAFEESQVEKEQTYVHVCQDTRPPVPRA